MALTALEIVKLVKTFVELEVFATAGGGEGGLGGFVKAMKILPKKSMISTTFVCWLV